MALAKTLKFGQQVVLLGDGATPEIFSAPCGFESLSLSVNIQTSETNVPDCADPDLPAWLVSSEVSKQMVITGEGVLDTDTMQMWREWLADGGEKTVRWKTSGAKADGGGHYEAPGIMSEYSERGPRGELWQIGVKINLNGKPPWTDAA